MNVALGPMKVAFNGSGQVMLNAEKRTGRLSGGGRDAGSGKPLRVNWNGAFFRARRRTV
jgi:hypothetical protein